MSGFSINIKYEDAQVQALLRRVMQATGNLTPAMKAIGEHLLRSTDEHFKNEQAPDGTPWKPLKVISYHLGYKLRQKKPTHTQSGLLTAAFMRYLAGRKILTDTGELRGSIHYQASATSVSVGSGKIYSAIHQLGGKAGRNRKVTIPARPYLGVSAADRLEIVAILERHISAGLTR